ncbi:MAG TPA: hypothetical protein VFA32_21005 [Dehalococcoidia bacterium]|nr:hypothetical protein [Dehalococcoidia bacterium]
MSESEQDSQLQPLPENPTPQDYGLPANPSIVDRNTWRNQERFLAAYVEHDGHPTIAARSSGIDFQTYRNWGISNKFDFNKRLELADAQVDDSLHAEIIRRGRDGVDHPVIYQGVITDWYKQYSDNLLMFEYKARHPEYRDNYQPQQPNTTINITQTVIEVHDYRNQGAVIEGQSRELTEEDKS